MSSAELPDYQCLTCGACCATYRVSFYWGEADALGLPEELTEPLTPWRACMTGTNCAQPRCTALAGDVGSAVACTVYGQRPSPCRQVIPGDDHCRRAREKHGLSV